MSDRSREQVVAANVDTVFIVQALGRDLNAAAARALPDHGLGERRPAGGRPDEGRPASPTETSPRWRRRVRRRPARHERRHRRRRGGARPVPRPRPDGRPARLVGRRQVDAREPPRRRGAARDCGGARVDEPRPAHDVASRARPARRRRAAARYPGHARAPALGVDRRARPGVRRDRRPDRRLPVQRLRAPDGAGLRRPRRRSPTARSRRSAGTRTTRSSASCGRSRSVTTPGSNPRRARSAAASPAPSARRPGEKRHESLKQGSAPSDGPKAPKGCKKMDKPRTTLVALAAAAAAVLLSRGRRRADGTGGRLRHAGRRRPRRHTGRRRQRLLPRHRVGGRRRREHLHQRRRADEGPRHPWRRATSCSSFRCRTRPSTRTTTSATATGSAPSEG